MHDKLDEIVSAYFKRPEVLIYYLRATTGVGLWRSEEILFERYFRKDDRLLEVGCGAGRIASGLYELGFTDLLGVDLSPAMIEEAKLAARTLEQPIPFEVGDATALRFEEGAFTGAIFGFNGIMQIPRRERRRRALREIRRVMAPGSCFIFSTHDRGIGHHRNFWRQEEERWASGKQEAALIEFGDRIVREDRGEFFVHIPSMEEVREDLVATDWALLESPLRQELANESEAVREFSDECRFWVVRKPER